MTLELEPADHLPGSCPECGTAVANVQGVRACPDCDWTARR